jgi:hypothetical protein
LSDEEDDKDDDDEEVHPYDWLDSMAEEGEQPEGSSLLIEGQMPYAQLLHHESEDPNIGGAIVAVGRGGEPLRLQGSSRPEGMRGYRPQETAGSSSQPLSLASPRRWQPGRGPALWR